MASDTNNGFNDLSTDNDDNVQDLLNQYKQKYGQQTQQEDTIPYDPNAGTVTNVGRFLLNNLAGDQGFGGGLPVAGTIKAGEELSMPLIQKVLSGTSQIAENTAPRLFGDTAETAAKRSVADITSAMTEGGLATAQDQAKTQQALSRAVDMQQRLDKQKALRKLINGGR